MRRALTHILGILERLMHRGNGGLVIGLRLGVQSLQARRDGHAHCGHFLRDDIMVEEGR